MGIDIEHVISLNPTFLQLVLKAIVPTLNAISLLLSSHFLRDSKSPISFIIAT